ncbi:tubulin epsilon and delta complex protein 2 isoform X2 [Fundulus heteroclitus]|uniref:tubulin epsilon and delta complex protein 2 isoform X2 n=1 Tax=Fundulus heteroclitus TaxID=8078 RepID=UPI00165B9FAE|nr:tubulin epsilon and delta complex protein 2 isoform X2 [Fundulus heteroclitus]
MSLLSAVEEVIKTYKSEQAKLNRSIQLYREILQSLTTQPEAGSDEPESADAAAADAESSPGEKEDIELLEQALQKALQVRSATEVSRRDGGKSKPSAAPKESGNVPAPSAAPKEGQATIKSSQKSAGLHREGHKKPGFSLSSRPSAGQKPAQSKDVTRQHPSSAARAGRRQASRRLQPAVLAGSASADQNPASLFKTKTVRSNVPGDNGPGKAASVSVPPSSDIGSFSGTDGSGAGSLHQQNGGLSEQIRKWKSLRSKQDRLWGKVITLQRTPEPGRRSFLQRMRATFPNDWPRGSPDEARFLLHRLTDQRLSLAQLCPTEGILVKQPSEMDSELLVGEETESPSRLTQERPPPTTAELHVCADKVKQEWKAWDRWRPEGGCLCPSEAAGAFGDGSASPLPLTITYRTERELQQLERLRMRVALLQQEIYLEQVLLDTLSPVLSSIRPGPGCPPPSVLRDVYSLLGEGGERFAAIVQDSEHD